MELSTFEDLLDLHGGDLARWPFAERAAAATLLSTSPDARALHARMAEIEAVLRRPAAPDAPGAIDGLAARAMRHRQETPARRLALRASWAAAAAIVLLVGITIGDYLGAAYDVAPDRVVAVALDATGTSDVE